MCPGTTSKHDITGAGPSPPGQVMAPHHSSHALLIIKPLLLPPPPPSHTSPQDASTFMMLHPFHIVFDAQLHVVQCGDAVRRVVDGLHGRDPHLPTTPHLNDLFRLQHPMVSPFTFEAMKGSLQNSFLLQVGGREGMGARGAVGKRV